MDIPSFTSPIPGSRPQWITTFARLGLSAKGVVYCLLGTLAFMAAFEINGKTTQDAEKNDVFKLILEQPFGKILLGIVVLGLFCYVAWRLMQAFLDTEQKGTDIKGIGRRVGYAFSGLVYGALAFYATKLVLNNSSESGGNSKQGLAAKILAQPFGGWLLIIIGLVTIGLGLNQIYRAVSGKYLKKVESAKLPGNTQKMLIRAGKIGYIARGVVWMVIGYLFTQAGFQHNPQKAGDTTSAFRFMENNSFGSFILGAVALGLICYGVFMFVRAKSEVIKT